MSLEKKLLRWLFRKPINKFKGWSGENITTFNIWLNIDSNNYHRFHNVIIPGKNGTAQLDNLLVSRYGIFIIETKNKKGWLYGFEHQSKWTQTLYGKKYTFQNPLRQTFRQKKVLASFLNLKESIIHPVIHFVGDCSLKSNFPPNVIISGLASYIKQFDINVISEEEFDRILSKLNEHISSSTLTTQDHIQSLKKRFSSNTVCPKCGSNLIIKTAKSGSKVGSQFLGCKSFPKCRFTKNL